LTLKKLGYNVSKGTKMEYIKERVSSILYESTKEFRVGVCGFSDKKFDKEKALEYLKEAFDSLSKGKSNITLVSGLTDLGVPGIAYKEAKKRKYKTVGIACKKASDYKCFDCDEIHLIGDNWGDESETFLDSIDALVRVGGGKQSLEETKKAKKRNLKVLEFDLEEQK
jgi:hypothetical protein